MKKKDIKNMTKENALKDLEKLKKGRKAPKVKPDPYRRGWEKLPQLDLKHRPKWKKPIDKYPGDPKKYTKPIDKFPADPKKWQPMKEGGRTGLKKGGPKPGTHDYFLLHKREKKAGGGTLLKQTVKKVAKKIKAKKDTESVRDVRAEGGRSTKISKRGPVYNKNTGRKIIR